MGQGIKEWTISILWKTALKNLEVIWSDVNRELFFTNFNFGRAI